MCGLATWDPREGANKTISPSTPYFKPFLLVEPAKQRTFVINDLQKTCTHPTSRASVFTNVAARNS